MHEILLLIRIVNFRFGRSNKTWGRVRLDGHLLPVCLLVGTIIDNLSRSSQPSLSGEKKPLGVPGADWVCPRWGFMFRWLKIGGGTTCTQTGRTEEQLVHASSNRGHPMQKMQDIFHSEKSITFYIGDLR